MDEARIGSVVRSLRIRRRLTQAELATQAGVARVSVSLLERGLGADLRLRSIHRICGALEIRLELDARWRGGDLERHLTARHSAMAEELSAWFLRRPEWIVRPEVSFSIWGERGVVDFIAWHPARRAMLLIEVKTEPVTRHRCADGCRLAGVVVGCPRHRIEMRSLKRDECGGSGASSPATARGAARSGVAEPWTPDAACDGCGSQARTTQ